MQEKKGACGGADHPPNQTNAIIYVEPHFGNFLCAFFVPHTVLYLCKESTRKAVSSTHPLSLRQTTKNKTTKNETTKKKYQKKAKKKRPQKAKDTTRSKSRAIPFLFRFQLCRRNSIVAIGCIHRYIHCIQYTWYSIRNRVVAIGYT